MKISVVMPTITGREESWARMVRYFEERTPGYELEVCSPKDYRNWPAGINAAQPTGDYLVYCADDLEPLPGWADAMVACLDRHEIPAPQVWNWHQKGVPADLAADGPPGSIPVFSRIPALTAALADEIGLWPEIDYYADNWVSDKARLLGWESRVTAGFDWIHHWHQHGRLDAGDWVGRNLPLYNAERVKLGLHPVNR
jgi:hypothetical protein